MKRILDSSKTLSNHLARSNSKSRRPYSRDYIVNEKKPSRTQHSVISNARRNVSIVTLDGRDDGMGVDLDVSKHNMPERLNWYWNLDEDHKRKITDPMYVKQAVQDTFMQRAQGGYHYKRSGSVRNSSSGNPQYENPQKSEVSLKSSKGKVARPPPLSPDKVIPKPQLPKRKRIIDTAKPIQLRPKAQVESRKIIKSGATLKEAGQKQLEEAKKKLYDPAPAVLDYLIEKHVPKMSGLQLRGRKENTAADSQNIPPAPSLMQRVFGWKNKAETKKNEQTDISITPRSIEVRKKSAKQVDQKLTKKAEDVHASSKSRMNRKPGKIRLSLREPSKKEAPESNKKPNKSVPTALDAEKTARQAQADEDREAIWSKMKASTAPAANTTQEIASVKKQVRDFELTPQIYPKGSLSMRKSYLPITACRPRSDIGRPAESHTSVYAMKSEEKPSTTKEAPSITDHILDSLKSIFSKMRRNSA